MEDDGESEESTKIRLKQFGKTKKLEYCKRIVSETNKENGVKGKVFCAKLLLKMRNGSYTTIPNERDYGWIHWGKVDFSGKIETRNVSSSMRSSIVNRFRLER